MSTTSTLIKKHYGFLNYAAFWLHPTAPYLSTICNSTSISLYRLPAALHAALLHDARHKISIYQDTPTGAHTDNYLQLESHFNSHIPQPITIPLADPTFFDRLNTLFASTTETAPESQT